MQIFFKHELCSKKWDHNLYNLKVLPLKNIEFEKKNARKIEFYNNKEKMAI